jgi:putative MATE family efflux protein
MSDIIQNIKYKSDIKLILALAIPAVMQTVVRSSFVIIDAYWIGKLGSLQLAALSVATFIVWGGLALGEMISTGANSLVAQAVGSQNKELAKEIAVTSIVNNFFYSLLLGLLLIPVFPLLYAIMGLTPEQSEYANMYLVPLFAGLFCITLLSTVTSIFRGYGDTKTPFYLLILALVITVFLTPILVLGINGYFRFEIKGAAYAALFSYFAASLLGYFILVRRGLTHSVFKYKINKSILTETFKIGYPISLNGVAFSMIYVFVAKFIADYGTSALAAMGICHRSESIAYQITLGFSLAATVLVGQNIGAGNPERAEKLSWKIFGICGTVILAYMFGLFFFSSQVAEFFTSDKSVVSIASDFNKITALILIFSVAEVVLSGAFSGAGDTLPPAIVSLPVNLLRIPFAALFSPLLGLNGIWIGICATVILKGMIILFWFRRGKWKTKKSKLIKSPPNILILTEVE